MLRLLALVLPLIMLAQSTPQVDVSISAWQEPEHMPGLTVVGPGRTFPYQVALTYDQADRKAVFFEFDFRDSRVRFAGAAHQGLCTYPTGEDQLIRCSYDPLWDAAPDLSVFWARVVSCGDGSPIVATARTNSDTATYSIECRDTRVYLSIVAQ